MTATSRIRRVLSFAAVSCLIVLAQSTSAQDVNLQSTITQFYAALEHEDLDALLAFVHPDSQAYQGLRNGQPSMFERFDYHYELSQARYIGQDDEFAYQSVQQRKTLQGTRQSMYDDTISHQLVVYAEAEENWLIWELPVMHWQTLDENGAPHSSHLPAPRCELCKHQDRTTLATALLGIAKAYYRDIEGGQVARALARVHPSSTLAEAVSRRARQSGHAAQSTVKTSNMHFIGLDNPYAYVSLVLSTTVSVEGIGGQYDTVSRLLLIFSEDDGEWKLWNELKLQVDATLTAN
jgi:hypothetical protein